MTTNMKSETLSRMLREAHEHQVERKRKALDAVDAMAAAVPAGFRWPVKMRRAYERAVRILR